MKRTRIALASLLLTGLLAGTVGAGGEATVTILKAPKDVVAGKTFEVAFALTPNWPMAKDRPFQPSVRAVCGDREVALSAVSLKESNHFKARGSLPSEGEWVITVDSRMCHTKMKPLILKAVAGKPAPI